MNSPQYESIPCDRCGCHAVFAKITDEIAMSAAPIFDAPIDIICFFCVQDEHALLITLGKRHTPLSIDEYLTPGQATAFWERQDQSIAVIGNLNDYEVDKREQSG